jgi:gas vesicle structural protein
MSVQASGGAPVERSQHGDLADVVGTILDKGVVIDVFARVSLVGIELLRADVRVVIASVDTYLRMADAVNRLGMGQEEPRQLPEAVEDITAAGSRGKTEGAIEGVADKVEGLVRGDRRRSKQGSPRRGQERRR